MVVQIPERTTEQIAEITTPKVDEDFIKMSAFTAELESAIRRAESTSGAVLGDNRFVISTGGCKWMIYIRRIDDISSEVVTEIID